MIIISLSEKLFDPSALNPSDHTSKIYIFRGPHTRNVLNWIKTNDKWLSQLIYYKS